MTVAAKIRELIGESGLAEPDAGGTPRAVPASEAECAVILQAAQSEGWRVRIEGCGGWMPADAPATLALSTRRLTGVVDLNPADMVVTVRAGTRWNELRSLLANEGTWVPLDPPGSDRSVGSVIACATAGPLRTGFGTIRDQLLGQTLLTADGRLVQSGGRVVKNVAGYDITKLAAGSFGAFGVITAVHLRLRAVPRADLTLVAHGNRDELLNRARSILDAGLIPAALELLSPKASPADRWTLAVRLVGSDVAVAAERDAITAASGLTFEKHVASHAADFWQQTLAGVTATPTTLRMGALPSSLDDALDTIAHYLDENCEDWISVNVLAGVVRWSGAADGGQLRLIRGIAAQHEMPVTLERAPWSVRSEVGHFGAYRDRVGRIVHSLWKAFDPQGVFAVPLGDRP
ncbi:MAG: FAD-binding protein [Gemmatimonadota bacterium]|nr:MAG: FAD-binding protein [Gemmatimonadota bacterium]